MLRQDNGLYDRGHALVKEREVKFQVERIGMSNILLRMWVVLQNLQSSESGQDLVEYALLVCLIALGAISGVNKVATAVTTVFTHVSSSLA